MTVALEKDFSVTQEFKVLPSAKYIENLIKQDADIVLDDFKEKILNKIENKRGHLWLKYNITSEKTRKYVSDNLKKWLNEYGYDLFIQDDFIEIFISSKHLNIKKIAIVIGFILWTLLLMLLLFSPILSVLFMDCNNKTKHATEITRPQGFVYPLNSIKLESNAEDWKCSRPKEGVISCYNLKYKDEYGE